MDIRIDSVTPAQAEAIESLLAMWRSLGSLGASRWTFFYAYGDGNFRPKVTVNGRDAKHTDYLKADDLWKNDEYRIDFDDLTRAVRAAGSSAMSARQARSIREVGRLGGAWRRQ